MTCDVEMVVVETQVALVSVTHDVGVCWTVDVEMKVVLHEGADAQDDVLYVCNDEGDCDADSAT